MLKTTQTLALWSALALSQAAWATPTCWTIAEGGNGHCYELAQLPGPDVSWAAALTAAQSTSYGNVTGHLATVSSAGEDALLLNLLTAQPWARFAWLGGYQTSPLALPDQGWTWVTGEPWDYTHWASGEPNDYVGVAESYLAMWGVNSGREPGTWNDEGYYVVEGWYLVEYDTPAPPCPTILFVNASAGGANNGRTWANAYTDLQAALDEAASLECAPVQIWVAAGVYHPSREQIPGDRRSATFRMANNLAFYGGFLGTETSLSQRRPFENFTILSGDLDSDDVLSVVEPKDGTARHVGSNAYGVVWASIVGESAVLDGFVIENADGSCDVDNIESCMITEGYGGGLVLQQAGPVVANCTFRRNIGSGVRMGPNSYPTIVNCRFLGNGEAGVKALGSQPRFVNCAFTGHNRALFLDAADSTLVNCTITGNMCDIVIDGHSVVDVYNSILWGNRDEVTWNSGELRYYRSCVWPAQDPAQGNISADPAFVDPAGPDGRYGTLDDDVSLRPGSPCIDAGDNAAIGNDTADLDADGVRSEELSLDLSLKPRRVDIVSRPDTGAGSPPIVDMGPYESDQQLPCPQVLFVDASSQGANNGRSWADAYADLQAALDEVARLDCGPVQIWVAAGVYHPSRSAIPGDRRSATFVLTKNLSLYGGFAGGETGLAQRKPFENLTILSGDLDDDDSPTPRQPDGFMSFNGTNSDAVVTANDTDASTVLDGLVIENGDGISSNEYTGGGLVMKNASPIIANCTFQRNGRAGLMATDNCHVRMVNCRFFGNWWNGVQVSDSPTELVNCGFSGQYTALVASGQCRPKLVNCTLAYNYFAIESGWPAQVDLYNSIIWGNVVVSDGFDNVIHPYYSSIQLSSGVVLEEGSILADPRFVDAAGPDGVYGTLDDDLRLSFSSPCIDAGSNAALPTEDVADLDADGVVNEGLPLDLAFKARRVDDLAKPDTGSGTAAIVDMGAYENDWTPPPHCPHPLYVDAAARGANNGQSWADAYTDLQAALDETSGIACGPVQVWVAKGVYRPSKAALPNDRRTATFRMADQLALYGGFAGGETSLTQRKPFENLTILSGDLDNDDPAWVVAPNGSEPSHAGANSYWVVEARGVGESAVLDGFVLENGDKISDGGAGGTYSGGFGGGLMVDSSSATIANCIFRRNVGGGIGMRPNSNPTILNCRFLGNFSVGVEAYGCNPAIVNCTFTGHRQALFFDYSRPKLINCTITGNGMAIGIDGGAVPVLANCIVWGNESFGYAGETGVQARHSLIQWYDELYPGEGNIDADPLFVNAPGPDGQYGTLDDDLRLQPQSPCADSGDNTAIPNRDTADLDGDGIVAEELPFDLDLKARRADNPFRADTGLGAPPVVDMGAYEYYTDCNHNGVNDQEDIANGTSQDCNNNGLPDECDVATGDLTWSPPTSIATGPTPFSIAAGDLNADGRTDLIVGYFGTYNGSRYVGGGVTVLINQGNRAFASANYPTGDRPESIAIADFNEDGKPDLATADSDSQSLSLLAQQPGGWFYRVANIPVEARPKAIAAGNLDGLNRPEYVVGHANGVTVFAYEDGEGYRAIGQYLSEVWVNSVALADLDRNGTLDIVTASQSATSVHVLFGRGDRTFGEPVQYTQGVDEVQHVTVADIDNDGDLDLVVSDQGLNGILVMRNTGNGSFDVPRPYEFGDSVSPRATAAADFDGDGDLDLAVADIINPSLLVLRNDGDGHFGSAQVVEAQVAQWFAVQADLDGDGDADVAVVGLPSGGRILWNETKPTSRDCNGNHVPDECDIQAGSSQDANGNGVPDECEPAPPCPAERILPPGYVPGTALTSGIEVKPGANVAVYAVEDTLPSGWTVGAINEGGLFDAATRKVKWGPFLDNQARTLTYEATPPAGTQGSQCFGPGVVSMDGGRAEICGNACVEPCFDHPADTNHDRRLVVDEVTAYAAAWKRGNTWPTPPNPIPIGYVTRAGALWKHGETYCCDPNQAPPMLWVNCTPVTPPAQAASETTAGASATRTVAAGAGFFTVTIKTSPAGASAYAIEEAPPAGPGWIVSEITDDGHFDAAAGRVRWGPFHDGQDRTFTYRLTGPDTSSLGVFTGILSTDGTDRPVAGVQTTVPLPADLDRDWDVDLDDAQILGSCLTGPAVPLQSTDCRKADLDKDGDVDQSDFGLLQRCYSGANAPADANCTN